MPINTDTVNEAYDEAIRFCTKVEELRDTVSDVGNVYAGGSIQRAAVRRSSMDLTRALTKLRAR